MKDVLLPEVGKIYNCFDDGKIKRSRHFRIVITEVLPFRKVSAELKKAIKEEQKMCDWLYAKQTDYVVFGVEVEESKNSKTEEKHEFIRTKNGGWFSFGWFASELDIDESLYNQMIANEQMVSDLKR